MENIKRYLYRQINEDLKEKMVFIGGPRQVGKTTLAKKVLGTKWQKGYLNWDIKEHREFILKQDWPNTPIWAFDEVHKYHGWRNMMKGIFDEYGQFKKILVTGSAKLDFYRYSGDSLQGRYHHLRMHPLSVSELKIKNQQDFLDLIELGGFPEPFFKGSKRYAKRWSLDYRDRLIEEEIRDLERVQDLGHLEMLMIRLPDLVASPLSINSIREDLQVSHRAVSSWLMILERLYSIFRISPVGGPKIRAVKKEQKHYHFDWSLIKEPGKRFENLVACHLLKWIDFQRDAKGEEMELRYFRDVYQREVDFVVMKDQKPIMAIECKWNDDELSKSLKYFNKHFPDCECWQLSATGTKDYITTGKIRVGPALPFLQTLI